MSRGEKVRTDKCRIEMNYNKKNTEKKATENLEGIVEENKKKRIA